MNTLRIKTILALLCCFLPAGDGISQAIPARFTIHLSSSTPEIKDGGEEVLILKMTNIWNHPLSYGVMGPGGLNADFHFHVVDQQGNEVRETPFGMRIHGTDPNSPPWSGSSGVALLPIGQTQTRVIKLGKEYDCTAPGTYKVTVSRFDELAQREVFSNQVQFAVLPK